ncbi:hypothetical protein BX666DRAFT_2030863 [Dichotomocladium elegans]|nr:hypothetical protein BX666DRAFT_2030863 [Dichotomocladium elegans]
MEPTLIALILIGIPLGAWATYEGVEYIREWLNKHQERKAYENYIRTYNDKQSGYTPDYSNNGTPMKNAAFSTGWTRVSSGTAKNRVNNRGWEHYRISEQDLLAMEYELEERNTRLKENQVTCHQTEVMQTHQRDVLSTKRPKHLMGSILSNSNNSIGNNGSDSSRSSSSPSRTSHPLANPPEVQDHVLCLSGSAIIHPSSNEEEDQFFMPAPHQYMRRDTDESDASYCWANVHSRGQSDGSDVSYSSISNSSSMPKSESPSLSYGVQSISSEDNIV